MSRTHKDKPRKFQSPEYDWKYGTETHTCEVWSKWYEGYVELRYSLQLPGVKTKKKRRVDTEDHWMNTPSWWIREFMTVPQRAAGRTWERNVVREKIEDLDAVDKPNISRKPHLYFW